MDKPELAHRAYDFLTSFKMQVMRQIEEVNAIADGELQDGFTSAFIEDGWVSLKGYSWGFVLHYDEPVRLDMTFGPDWPFVGHRITFVAKPSGDRIVWINQEHPNEVLYGTEQLARYGLRKLACKAGDSWIFDDMNMPDTISDTFGRIA
jgi:hypothetical protein